MMKIKNLKGLVMITHIDHLIERNKKLLREAA